MYFFKEDISPYLVIKILIVFYFEVLWCLSITESVTMLKAFYIVIILLLR